MFRIPFSFTRLFRLRGRRSTRADANLRRSSSVPTPFKSSQPVVPATQVEPINVPPSSSSTRKRPRSLLINPFSGLSPISKSPFTPTPNNVTIQSASIPTIIIGRDTVQEFTPAPLPPVTGYVGPQIPTDGVSVLGPPQPTSTKSNARIPFQLPTTLARIDDRPESPLSTCSTLIIEIGMQRDAENVADNRMGSASAVPSIDREPRVLNDEEVHSGGVRAASAGPTDRSDIAKIRHASLITPQPVRPDGVRVNRSRFSLPIRPRTVSPIVIDGTDGVTRNSRRERRRASLLSFSSESTATPKEGRMARFSKEFSKPETQEALEALAWRM